jgi:hypothetical protein
MQCSLLSLRLRLQRQSVVKPVEPVLRVGSTCVAALWDCGCAGVGADFDSLTYIPCSRHEDMPSFPLLERRARSRVTLTLPHSASAN